MANMSEDALFKALLKNKPGAQKQQAPVKPVQPPVRKEEPRPTPEPAPVYEKEPVIEIAQRPAPIKTDAIEEAIIELNKNVNTMFGFIKTVIVPVLVLILIVGILILVKI